MKKLLILAFALAIAAPTVIAQDNKPTAKYSGTVEKYDTATKTLTITRKDKKQGDFVVTDTSEVLNNNAKADAAAIAPGQKAEVEFSMDGAKKMVKKLKLSGAATTKQ